MLAPTAADDRWPPGVRGRRDGMRTARTGGRLAAITAAALAVASLLRAEPPPPPKARLLRISSASEPMPPPKPVRPVPAEPLELAPVQVSVPVRVTAPVGTAPVGTAFAAFDPSLPGSRFAPEAEVVPVGCSSCGGGPLLPPLAVNHGGHGGDGGCGGPGCVPGRGPCHGCDAHGFFGRFACCLYECICCPDPCYQPRWLALADAAFFVESARPVTQTRLRWDAGLNGRLLDRNEFFWARADGNGKGPKPVAPFLAETGLRYDELRMYTEAATGAIGVSVDTPYRSVDPDLAPHAAGFADLTIATKTLLFDCELLQLAMLFRTHIPAGNFGKGLGTGHVSLEPGLIVGLKLSPKTYLQTMLTEWIPLGGDPDYSGAILRTGTSINSEVCRIHPDVPLIATFEVTTMTFQDGLFTDPVLGVQRSSGRTYATLGPGLRLVICDKMDFGVGAAISVQDVHFA